MLENENWRKNSLTSQEPRSERRSPCYIVFEYRFNEMWFLTVDPFVRVSVFIAKLSKRYDCWRVIEDFHIQEYIQLFDIHNCLFMRPHFSIGCYDYDRTTRFRQSIHFSRIQVLFADHVHRRFGVDNKFSFLSFKI